MDNFVNNIICGDALDILALIPDECVTLVVTSPPYNLNISYGSYDDDMPWDDYIVWLTKVWKECKRVLRIGGRMAINMATITNRQADKNKAYIRQIIKYLGNQMDEIGMLPFAEIVWYKQDAAGKKTAWGSWLSPSCPVIRSTHEYLCVYSKDQFQLKGDIEQSDLEKEEFEQWTLSTWFITPETRHPGGHPVPFPPELVERAIKLWTYRGDIVLDPFMGSGTTAHVACQLNRRYIGIDIDESYVEYAKGRIIEDQDMFDKENNLYIKRSDRLKKKGSGESQDEEPMIFDD